jgi:hypothetical protein
MPTVRLFHWRASEAKPLIEELRDGGYTVIYPGEKANGNYRSMTPETHAAIIDLSRMPSHGRYVGAELRGRKSSRHIPIVFLEGDSEKVEQIRKLFPDAVYTSRKKLLPALKKVQPIADPAAPPRMMQSYGDRSTAQKLGIRENSRVAVVDPPPGYLKVIGPLPANASLEEETDEALPLTLWFVRDADLYLSRLPAMRHRAASSRLWIIYPKLQAKRRSDAGLNQTLIRQSALDVGLVDYKICSLNDTWTGMLFTRKK